jgi:putative endonuclease
MNVYFVYAIESEVDKRIYVGMSKDPVGRLKEHNAGKTKSTKGYRPWKLIFQQECKNRVEASVMST